MAAGGRLSKDAELPQKAQQIDLLPVLGELAVSNPVQVHRGDPHRPAGGGDPGERAPVGAGGAPSGRDLVTFGQLVQDLNDQVREGAAPGRPGGCGRTAAS